MRLHVPPPLVADLPPFFTLSLFLFALEPPLPDLFPLKPPLPDLTDSASLSVIVDRRGSDTNCWLLIARPKYRKQPQTYVQASSLMDKQCTRTSRYFTYVS